MYRRFTFCNTFKWDPDVVNQAVMLINAPLQRSTQFRAQYPPFAWMQMAYLTLAAQPTSGIQSLRNLFLLEPKQTSRLMSLK